MKEPTTGATGLRGFRVRLHRASLQLKITIVSTVVTAAVLIVTFWALSVQARRSTGVRIAEQLSHHQATLLQLHRRSLAQLVTTASILTQSPQLLSALRTSTTEGNLGRPREDLPNTVENELKKMLGRAESDLLVVTDERGRVFAATARDAESPVRGKDLSRLPAVRRALDPFVIADSGELAVFRSDHDYHVAVYPILQGEYTIGALMLGQRLEAGLVAAVRAAFDGQVVVTAGRDILVNTIRSTDTTLATALRMSVRGDDSTGVVDLGGAQHIVTGLPIGRVENGEGVKLWLLQPLDNAAQAMVRPLARTFLLFGTLAILIVALGSALATRSVLRPFQEFVTHMGSAAANDSRETAFDARFVPIEVRTLHQSLGRLMRSISAKQGELQQRSTELTAANAVLRDEIRERERIERDLRERDEQLRQSQKMEAIGTLAGGIAHDFNNLITAVSGFTQLALMEAEPDSPLAADLKQVLEAANRAGHLTKQLLAFSRKQVMSKTVLDLGDVVQGMVPMLGRLLGERVTLRVSLDHDVSRVLSDRGQLEQVLLNLAINARDAMPHGGVLTIRAANARDTRDNGNAVLVDQRVLLSVSDTGTGIPEAIRSRIFEPFFTTKETGKGTGLGLSTVYGIVKQSGGTIDVDSKIGVGTTFTIALPAASESGQTDAAEVEGVDMPRGAETILLVEDDPAVRALARRTLTDLGYTVLPAVDGVEALRLARGARVDLILSDIVMPRMSGPQLVQRFLAEYPAPVVVFMSGYADEALISEGRMISYALLRKPFTPAALARTIRQAIDASRKTAPVAL